MRGELKREFVPYEYQMNLYMAVLNLNQGSRQTVADYTEQFFLFTNRAEWVDQTEQHKVWRYLNGLNKSIQNALYLKNFFDISSAIEFAYKAEELLQRLSPSKRLEPKMSPGFITFHVQDENTETVTHPDCGKPLLMHGSVVGSPPPKNIKHWCEYGIFWTRCTSGGKLCDVTFNSGTRENYVSEDMVTELNLKTELLPNPFKVGGILGGAAVEVDRACRVSFSIGSKFKDNICCYVLPTLKTSHLLLGTTWLHDRQAILSGGDNAYYIKFKGGQTMLTSLPSFHNMCCTVIRAS
ncbi:hypothetical protein FRX31_010031 [Thalictrum thalictroides]|uniref:Retrotransposon gag domain-containing protein n=1 Tax=Thalictrum thalictroides TaxID=46969 RepID=A0A7J6WSM9_THATH|nr:hypothetical protein FRX31_010031 [Thalictrum thalictroides]